MKDLKSLNRVLLKLSGEALAGEKKTGFDEATVLMMEGRLRSLSAVVTSGEEEPARIWKERRLTRLVCLQL